MANYVLNRTGLEVDNILSNAESHVNSTNIHVTQQEKTKLAGIDSNATSIPFITGTQTATTGSWTGNAPTISALTDGLRIFYWLPYNGSGNATLNLTLADGSTTGAISCYRYGTSTLTTHYSAGSIIALTYRKDVSIAGSSTKYTGWWCTSDYYTSSATTVNYTTIKAGSAITSGNIIVGKDGVYEHLKNGNAFDITYPILYCASNVSSGSTTSNTCTVLNLNIATTQPMTLTEYKPIFIKGNLNGNLFTPVSTTPLTQTVPTSADGYEYILLGVAYSTTAFRLISEHPIFAYKGGAFGQISSKGVTDISASGQTVTYTRSDGSTGSFTTQDMKVTNTLGNTTKAYVTGTTSASTNTGTQIFDTGVYLGTTAGRLEAGSLTVGATSSTTGKCAFEYDTTNECVNFVFN